MRYTPAGHELSSTGIDLLLCSVPGRQMRRGMTAILTVLMDPPLRSAAGYRAPSAFVKLLTITLLEARRLCIRHLCLPRPEFLRATAICDASLASIYLSSKYSAASAFPQSKIMTKSRLTSYIVAPHFVAPTVWNRWGLGAWWSRCLGLPLPGDYGDRFDPKGYSIPELGPRLGKTSEFQAREENAVKRLIAQKGLDIP